MMLTKTFEKFAEGTPVCVMIRGGLEYALPETFVNQMFERTACRQYTRSLLFSQIVDLMGSVVCQVFPSVNRPIRSNKTASPSAAEPCTTRSISSSQASPVNWSDKQPGVWAPW